MSVTAEETRRIRIDYQEQNQGAYLTLKWVAPGASTATVVPGSVLKPDYGLATSSTTDDSLAGAPSTRVPSSTTQTAYGSSPWLGQPASTTVDPAGLALSTSFTYEPQVPAGTANSWLRPLTRTLPAGPSTTVTSTYYADTDTGDRWLARRGFSVTKGEQ